MNRRVYLGAIGGSSVGFAGCLSLRESVSDDEETGIEEDHESESDDEGTVIEEDPRIDEPPHPIDPETARDYDGIEETLENWNEEYLGEQIPTDPSLTFEQLEIPIGFVTDEKFGLGRHIDDSSVNAYRVVVVENESKAAEVFLKSDMDEKRRQELENVDFDSTVLVLVETGIGSGTIEHRWARVEEGEDSIHLHGYYTSHYETTADLTTRFSVLEVDRPSELELARISMTLDVDERVHFNSTEAIVTV